MVATKEQLEELEQFFNYIEVPKTLKIYNNSTILLDLPTFVNENLEKLKNDILAPVVARPRYDDLLEIRKVLSANI